MSPIRIAKESSATDLEYRADAAQPSQLKRMESLTHPLKNISTFGAVWTSLILSREKNFLAS
jgi:hypothetical protein